jgi:hypothetical protein
MGGQVAKGDRRIIGVMLESNLVEGAPELVPGKPLVYGQSITDACIRIGRNSAATARACRRSSRRRIVGAAAVGRAKDSGAARLSGSIQQSTLNLFFEFGGPRASPARFALSRTFTRIKAI